MLGPSCTGRVPALLARVQGSSRKGYWALWDSLGQNNLKELHALLKFLWPSVLADQSEAPRFFLAVFWSLGLTVCQYQPGSCVGLSLSGHNTGPHIMVGITVRVILGTAVWAKSLASFIPELQELPPCLGLCGARTYPNPDPSEDPKRRSALAFSWLSPRTIGSA